MRSKPIFFLVLFIMSVLISVVAFAGMDERYDMLKQKDIERDVRYRNQKYSQIPDPQEKMATRDLFEDADDDGMPNSWETANGLDPNDPDDAWFDPDGDEVVNLFEYQLNSGLNDPSFPPVITAGPSGADYTDVAAAIDESPPGTVIRVATGLYAGSYTTFSTKVVMIQGGWNTDFSQRNLALYPVIFDGLLEEEILYFSMGSGEGTVILDGIHFKKGKGSFGAVNLAATGSVFLKTSIVNCTITESEATSSYGGVLRINSWDKSQADRTIANTIIAGNPASGIVGQVTDSTTAHWRFLNTTISFNTNGGGSNGYGIESFTLDDGNLSAHLYNDIVWGNEQEEISISRSITVEAEYSDIGEVETRNEAVYQAGDGMIDKDPAFADTANMNYHLSQGSPCINVGTNRGVPLIDFEGQQRIVGATVDLGADEYEATISRGDVNGDGNINVLDMVAIANHIIHIRDLTPEEQVRADCNGDGNVNVLDMVAIANVIIHVFDECPGNGCKPELTPEVMRILKSLESYMSPAQFASLVILVKDQYTPNGYTLQQNYPNPFNPKTDIRYQIADGGYPTPTTLKVYNVLGQEVRTLVTEVQEPGLYTVTWDGKDKHGEDVTSGVYFYRLQAGDFTATKRMALLK